MSVVVVSHVRTSPPLHPSHAFATASGDDEENHGIYRIPTIFIVIVVIKTPSQPTPSSRLHALERGGHNSNDNRHEPVCCRVVLCKDGLMCAQPVTAQCRASSLRSVWPSGVAERLAGFVCAHLVCGR